MGGTTEASRGPFREFDGCCCVPTSICCFAVHDPLTLSAPSSPGRSAPLPTIPWPHVDPPRRAPRPSHDVIMAFVAHGMKELSLHWRL